MSRVQGSARRRSREPRSVCALLLWSTGILAIYKVYTVLHAPTGVVVVDQPVGSVSVTSSRVSVDASLGSYSDKSYPTHLHSKRLPRHRRKRLARQQADRLASADVVEPMRGADATKVTQEFDPPPPPPTDGRLTLAPAPPLPPLENTEDEVPAAADRAVQTCLSFNRRMCPPLNLSIQTAAQQRDTHAFCAPFVKLEREFKFEAGQAGGQGSRPRFCGRRLRRLNPCWSEAGITSCLPHFFIIGEMKCGTTSLYHFLTKHPRVVVPRVKEPRFMQPGRFAQTSVSRYKVNFDAAVGRPEAVTFDASPVYLRSEIARQWLSRWLPRARLIAMVRNPSQRAYSHWKMGREWMASKCVEPSQVRTLEPIEPFLTFEALVERSLMQINWASCIDNLRQTLPKGVANSLPSPPQRFTWMALPLSERSKAREFVERRRASQPARDDAGEPPEGPFDVDSQYNMHDDDGEVRPIVGGPSHAPVFDCLRSKDEVLTSRFYDELVGAWPVAGDVQTKRLQEGVRLLGHCSEMMLAPPGLLNKGAMYASELEKWAAVFPRSQLKVIHTDDLSDSPQRVMDSTFDFLDLQRVSIGNETRMCVHGKAGVMDVLNAFEGSVRIGKNGNETAVAAEHLHVARCDNNQTEMSRDASTGAMHHVIAPALLKRLRRYFEPHNQQLYRFLGRDLHW